jgi:hypothetical protein
VAGVPAVIQNTLGVRTWDDVRNMIHSGAPALSAALVGWNVVDSDKATLIAGLVVAMASPLAAYPHADNAFRKYLYGVIAAFQAVLIGVVGVVDSPILDLCGSAVAILGGMVASTNTPVSRDADYSYVPPVELHSVNPVVPLPAEQANSLNTGGWRGL